MTYVLVVDGEVIRIGLPRTATLSDGTPVSGFDRLPPNVLSSEGWYELTDGVKPEYNPETEHLVFDGYEVNDSIPSVITTWRVEPNPEPAPPPPPTSEQVLTDALAFATRRIVSEEIRASGDNIDEDTMSSLAPLFPELSLEGMAVKADEVYRWNHTVVQVIQDHTTEPHWDQGLPPALYKVYLQAPEEGEDYAEWVQPTGGHDAYPAFFPGTEDPMRVLHNGDVWENTHGDGNVWEPGAFGWTKVEV